jgi:fucose permease
MKKLNARGTMVVACASFFALGVVMAGIGPALPNLAANASSGVAALGGVFTALYLGALLMQIVAGPLNDRIGQRPVLLVGLALLALGIFGMVASRALALTLACAIVAGLGQGALAVSANVLIAEVFPGRRAAALNLLNVFFGAGAVAGPAIAGLTLQIWGSALPALVLGAGLLLLQLPLIPLLSVVPRIAHSGIPERSTALYRSPLLWMLGALLLLYVGSENGMGGWTATYLERTTALGATTAALVTSGFWLALTAGRMIAALLGARLLPYTLLLISLGGALAGGLLLAGSTGNAPLTIVAVLLLGVCFGPIFPTVLAITTATFRSTSGTAVSILMAMGSIGGMVIPWSQGVLLERSSPSASVLFIAGGILAMFALHIGRQLLPAIAQDAHPVKSRSGI